MEGTCLSGPQNPSPRPAGAGVHASGCDLWEGRGLPGVAGYCFPRALLLPLCGLRLVNIS